MPTATLEERVDILEPRVKDLEVNVHRLDQLDMKELLARIDDVGKQAALRFTKLEDLIGNVIVRLDNMDKRTNTIENGLNAKIDGLDRKIDTVEKGLNQKIDNVADSITGLKWFVMINLVVAGVGFAFLTLVLSIGFRFFGHG